MSGAYTLDVICSTAFGLDVDSQNDPENTIIKNVKEILNISIRNPKMIIMCKC